MPGTREIKKKKKPHPKTAREPKNVREAGLESGRKNHPI